MTLTLFEDACWARPWKQGLVGLPLAASCAASCAAVWLRGRHSGNRLTKRSTAAFECEIFPLLSFPPPIQSATSSGGWAGPVLRPPLLPSARPDVDSEFPP
jgi:hypothetical protein